MRCVRLVVRAARLEPTSILLLLSLLVSATFIFVSLREPGHDPRGSGRYETADFDTLHLNLRQRKLILITENNKVGSILGELLSEVPDLVYWDTPFQVCWQSPTSCQEQLHTLHTRDLLQNLLNCQQRLLAFLKDEVYTSAELDQLVDRCAKPKYQLVRISTLRLSDLAVLQYENPSWKVRSVFLVQDPRARLAAIKHVGKYVDKAGFLRHYTNRTYKEAISQMCSNMAGDVQHTADFEDGPSVGNLQAYIVKHEDLLHDLEQETRGVLSAFGVPWSKQIEKTIKMYELSEQGERDEKESKVEPDSGITDTQVEAIQAWRKEQAEMNRWKEALTRKEIFAVERNVNCAKIFRHAGYPMFGF